MVTWRPHSSNGGQRQPPQKLTDRPAPYTRPGVGDDVLARRIVAALIAIRSGDEDGDVEVSGIRVLNRVTQDDNGTIYYHMTGAAREILRSVGMLPWGN